MHALDSKGIGPRVSKSAVSPASETGRSRRRRSGAPGAGKMDPMPHPERATFRLPASALFIPVVLFFIATPLASASIWTVWLYLLPVYGLFYVLFTKTVADDQTITATIPLLRRRIAWADLDGFEFHGPRWAIAVTMDGKRIRLPMVRPRDLHRLAAVSGGRLALGEQAVEGVEAAASSDVATTMIGTDPTAGQAAAAEPTATVPDEAAPDVASGVDRTATATAAGTTDNASTEDATADTASNDSTHGPAPVAADGAAPAVAENVRPGGGTGRAE